MIKSIARNLQHRISRRVEETNLKRFLRTVDTVDKIKMRNADYANIREAICQSGTDKLSYFANGFTHEGGLYLQQNPDEFASLCLFLREHRPYTNYLEIGSASGGACLFLYREVGFANVWSMDDGQHVRAVEQKKNFSLIPNFQQFLGDSHSEQAKHYLTEHLPGKLDVAFIDGDHSYEGAWQDVELVRPHCRPGSLVIFHDTVACPEVRQVWMKSINDKLIKPLAEYVGNQQPALGIGIGSVI